MRRRAKLLFGRCVTLWRIAGVWLYGGGWRDEWPGDVSPAHFVVALMRHIRMKLWRMVIWWWLVLCGASVLFADASK